MALLELEVSEHMLGSEWLGKKNAELLRTALEPHGCEDVAYDAQEGGFLIETGSVPGDVIETAIAILQHAGLLYGLLDVQCEDNDFLDFARVQDVPPGQSLEIIVQDERVVLLGVAWFLQAILEGYNEWAGTEASA